MFLLQLPSRGAGAAEKLIKATLSFGCETQTVPWLQISWGIMGNNGIESMMVLLSGFSNLFDFKLYTWDDDPE